MLSAGWPCRLDIGRPMVGKFMTVPGTGHAYRRFFGTGTSGVPLAPAFPAARTGAAVLYEVPVPVAQIASGHRVIFQYRALVRLNVGISFTY